MFENERKCLSVIYLIPPGNSNVPRKIAESVKVTNLENMTADIRSLSV
jgi:hypothetical protein